MSNHYHYQQKSGNNCTYQVHISFCIELWLEIFYRPMAKVIWACFSYWGLQVIGILVCYLGFAVSIVIIIWTINALFCCQLGLRLQPHQIRHVRSSRLSGPCVHVRVYQPLYFKCEWPHRVYVRQSRDIS